MPDWEVLSPRLPSNRKFFSAFEVLPRYWYPCNHGTL